MGKIASIIDIKSAYSTQVNLREEFNDYKVNLGRMERYMPIRSHRSAFERIARALYDPQNKRFYLLTGSYGTGKSHLSLMIANYLSHPSMAEEIQAFFNNFQKAAEQDGDIVSEIEKWKLIRKNKKFLVCVCDYDSNDTFMEIVLKSIITALEREGIDSTQLATPYRESVRKIEEWKLMKEHGLRDFYSEFERLLANKLPGTTMSQFFKGLEKDLDSEKLYVFKQIHKELTTVDFTLDKNNLVAIVKDLIQSSSFQDQFQGIAIVFDEFDYILKGKRFDLHIFQAFGEFCSKSYLDGTPVFMLATGHRSFVSYKSRYNEDDFSVVSNRVEEVSLKTEGFEDIISKVVIPNKNSDQWNKYIRPNRNIFDAMTQSCKDHRIFTHLSNSGKKLREKIIENIYPMHPMATYVLLELSKDIASNNRSVFTFFTKPYRNGEEGSYNWYIQNNDIVDVNGKLNFYTVDYLFLYFSQLISSDNPELLDSKKMIIRNYEASLREWRKIQAKEKTLIPDEKDVWAERILHTLVLYHLANVVPNVDNMLFGLNVNENLFPDEAVKVKSVLRYLADKHILFHNRQSETYEFKKNDLIDIDGIVEEYVSKEEHYNISLVEEITRIGKIREYPDMYLLLRDDFYPGKSYNLEWSEDKRFLRFFTTVQELESKSFFEKLVKKMSEVDNFQNSYEGLSVVVICESLEEREKAKAIAMTNKNSRILIGIPRMDIPVKERVVRFIGIEKLPNANLSEQELALIRDKKKVQAKSIAEQIKLYSDDKNLVWIEKEGSIINVNNRDEFGSVSYVLQKLYDKKRTILKHPDLNKIHSREKNGFNALREAIERILDFQKDLEWDLSRSEDTADKRVFQGILIAANVIEIIEHNKTLYKGKFNANIDAFREVIPPLAAMIDVVRNNQNNLSVTKLISKANEFGIGQYASCLYIAIILRFFAETLFLKVTPHSQDVMKIETYSDIEDLIIKKKYPNAVIEIIELTPVEKGFTKRLYQLYKPTSIVKNVSIEQCYSLLEEWYYSLPSICKIYSLYEDNRYHKLINIFSGMKANSMPNFLFRKIQTIVGFDEENLLVDKVVDEILDFLQLAKLEMSASVGKVRSKLFRLFVELFNPEHHGEATEDDVVYSLLNWYESLSEAQKDIGNQKHNSDSRILVKAAGSCINAEQCLLEELPVQLGQQKVLDWSTDKSSDFLYKVKHVKFYVEQTVVAVEDPIIRIPNDWAVLQEGKEIIHYFGDGTIDIKSPNEDVVVLYTDDGNDPLNSRNKVNEIENSATYSPLANEFTIQLVSRDSKGRYGSIRKYQFRAEKLRFQARPLIKERQAAMNFNSMVSQVEDEESLVIPSIPYDNRSLEICMESIIEKVVKKNRISKKSVRAALQNLLHSLEE